jgi:hypothetical protein
LLQLAPSSRALILEAGGPGHAHGEFRLLVNQSGSGSPGDPCSFMPSRRQERPRGGSHQRRIRTGPAHCPAPASISGLVALSTAPARTRSDDVLQVSFLAWESNLLRVAPRNSFSQADQPNCKISLLCLEPAKRAVHLEVACRVSV